jgi:hypothetical protein
MDVSPLGKCQRTDIRVFGVLKRKQSSLYDDAMRACPGRAGTTADAVRTFVEAWEEIDAEVIKSAWQLARGEAEAFGPRLVGPARASECQVFGHSLRSQTLMPGLLCPHPLGVLFAVSHSQPHDWLRRAAGVTPQCCFLAPRQLAPLLPGMGRSVWCSSSSRPPCMAVRPELQPTKSRRSTPSSPSNRVGVCHGHDAPSVGLPLC